jgi:cytidine deaminase
MTICAERNAIFNMVAHGQKNLDSIVIFTPTKTPTAPCGACRQVINEFNPDAFIISVCEGSELIKNKLSEILPNSFGPKNLA